MKIGKVVKVAGKLARSPIASRTGTVSGSRTSIPSDTGDSARRTSRARRKRCRPASRRWPTCRTCSTRRTAGRCCSCSRPWMRPARTAPSSTSCPASIRRAARCHRSRRPRPRNSTTTSSGAAPAACRSAGASASSTAPTTRKCWCVRVHPELLREPEAAADAASTRTSGSSASGTFAPTSATSNAQRHRRPQVLPARLEGGAEAPLPRAASTAREELEVLGGRRARARLLEGLHARLRGRDPRHRHARQPVVRRAGRQQVVHPHHRRLRVIETLASMGLHYPKVSKAKLKELAAVRKVLMAEKN